VPNLMACRLQSRGPEGPAQGRSGGGGYDK